MFNALKLYFFAKTSTSLRVGLTKSIQEKSSPLIVSKCLSTLISSKVSFLPDLSLLTNESTFISKFFEFLQI